MSEDIRIITNNVPREILSAHELTPAERTEFEYLDWSAIERGEESASFVRYRGWTYDLGEFMSTRGMPQSSPLASWDGYQSDSFFSGVLVRYPADTSNYPLGDWVICGTYLA